MRHELRNPWRLLCTHTRKPLQVGKPVGSVSEPESCTSIATVVVASAIGAMAPGQCKPGVSQSEKNQTPAAVADNLERRQMNPWPDSDSPIETRRDTDDGLSVTVTRTAIGTYRVVFRDDDADETIESRVYVSFDRAQSFAHTLIGA